MDVLILAGGAASRMWPVKKNKLLLTFSGRPLIVHLVEMLAESGMFARICLTTSPSLKSTLSGLLAAWVKPENVAVQEKPTGMADAVLAAAGIIKDEELLIVNGDDLFEPELLREFGRSIARLRPEIATVGRKVEAYFPGGYLEVKNGRLVRLVEKPGRNHEPSDMVKLVVDYYRHPRALIKALGSAVSTKDDVYEVALDASVRAGKDVLVHRYEGAWVTVKHPWDVLAMMDYLLGRIEGQEVAPGVMMAKRAQIEGPVVLEEGVRLFPGAVVKGPAWIGKDTIIGNNSLVRESMIGAGSVVGFATEVARSWVGPECWFHCNYVGDSVLESRVAMGAGAVTANLRLDEREVDSVVKGKKTASGRVKLGLMSGDRVRIGVNSAVMPGVKIGEGSFLGPGTVLREDIPDGGVVFVQQKYVLKKNKVPFPRERREGFKSRL